MCGAIKPLIGLQFCLNKIASCDAIAGEIYISELVLTKERQFWDVNVAFDLSKKASEANNMRHARATHVGVTFNNTVFLKAQLEAEITKLERQLDNLRRSDEAANFALLESYKEMICSRRAMLSDLPH